MVRFSALTYRAVLIVLGAASLSGWPVAPAAAQDGPSLAVRISRAIERGRKSLMPVVERNTRNPPGDYLMGRIALPLAAVLKAGASSTDPIVVEAFKKLESLPLQKTYSVACYLFALDAFWKRRYQEALEAKGPTIVLPPREAQGKVRAKIAECVEWLVNARIRGRGVWNYEPAGGRNVRHDFSNTQFAVLGLQIGLEHGVRIPASVFVEIARTFVNSQAFEKERRELRITYGMSADMLAGPTRVEPVRRYVVAPGGWGYTAGQRGPYASMTAAGASSLQVAINGLKRGDARMRAAAERALLSAYAWIEKHFAEYVRGNRHYYYTLYSLEKVGDLGSIEKFGDHDWYAEGAEELLRRQRDDGSWGNYVNTAFALLFLTRATRLSAVPAPKIYTRAQGEGQAADTDLVYLSRIDGFVSARAILALIAETRRPDLIPVGEEVVRNYRPERRGDLVPQLLLVWGGAADRVARFAREALEEITGERYRRPEDYRRWYEDYSAVLALEKKAAPSESEVAAKLSNVESTALKSLLLDIAQRHRMLGLAERLLGELEIRDHGYRRKVHSLLRLWTGAEIPAPAADTESAWAETIDRWRAWWAAEGRGLAMRRRLEELLGELERAPPAKAGELVEAIVKLGPAAEPFLEEVVRRDEFPFAAIEALERLRGRPLGLRP